MMPLAVLLAVRVRQHRSVRRRIVASEVDEAGESVVHGAQQSILSRAWVERSNKPYGNLAPRLAV